MISAYFCFRYKYKSLYFYKICAKMLYTFVHLVAFFSSIVVPLNGDKYWSQNAQKYTGKSHREIFNDSLGEIYKSLYRGASVPD